MAAKAPTINLIDYRPYTDAPKYHSKTELLKIESIKNSTMFIAGTWISGKTADELISRNWTVNIRQTRNSDF